MKELTRATVSFDVTEVKREDARTRLKQSIRALEHRSKEIDGFWRGFLRTTASSRISHQALVISDLGRIVSYYRKAGRHRWVGAVRRARPYFVALVRTKHDVRCVSLIDDLMRHSDFRLTVCCGLECEEEMRDCLNEALAALDPESLIEVRLPPVRPDALWVEFGDGLSGFVSWGSLGIEDAIENVVTESATVGRRGRAIEFTMNDGELFDIDSVSLRAILDRDFARAVSQEARVSDAAVGRRVRAARRSAGLTQTALGERAGLDQAVISRLERGKHEPRLDTLRRVAAALELGLPDLLSFTA
jgi:ribosome-binding protein aMBF1 (putative translation factor)